jgi:hypothetical protein
MSSFTRGVTVRPGVIVLTVIPSAPTARANERAKPTTPAFAAT